MSDRPHRSLNKTTIRRQLLAAGGSAVLFFLILLIARLTTPAEIPSDYYADSGSYAFGYSNLRGRVLLYLVLLFLAEILLLYRNYLRVVWLRIRKNGKTILCTAVLCAVSAAAGGLLVFAALSRSSKEVSEFWILTGAVLTAVYVLQIRLLLRMKGPVVSLRGENGKRTFVFAIAVVVFLVLLFFEWRECERSTLFAVWHFTFPFAVIFLETILLALLFARGVLYRPAAGTDFSKACLFAVLILAAGYLCVFLPFVSPDENVHYLSAYHLSDLFLGKLTSPGDARLIMRMEDFLFFQGEERALSADYFAKLTDGLHLFAQEKGFFVTEASMSTNSVFGYFPAAFGLVIARILHLGGTAAFLSARVLNILFFVFVLSRLMKKERNKTMALFSIAVIPMVLHLTASCSYDAPTLAFTALFLSQVAAMSKKPGPVRAEDLLKCLLYSVLLAPSKLVYAPLVFLVFVIPWKHLSESRARANGAKILIAGCGLAAIPVITVLSTWMFAFSALGHFSANSTAGHVLSWNSEQGYTVEHILADPGGYVMICLRTAIRQADEFFLTMFGVRLGWLNIEIPILCVVISCLLFLTALHIKYGDENEPEFSFGAVLWTVVLGAAVVMAVFAAMTLSWTPVTYDHIAGIQGRYFLPLLFIPLWIGRRRLLQVSPSAGKWILPAAVMLNLWILTHVYASQIFV